MRHHSHHLDWAEPSATHDNSGRFVRLMSRIEDCPDDLCDCHPSPRRKKRCHICRTLAKIEEAKSFVGEDWPLPKECLH